MATIESFEDKVVDDFLFFLEHFNKPFSSLTSQSDKEICQKWLDKLTIETYKTVEEKRVRNIYLSQLIMSMDERKLSAPFTVSPKVGRLSLDGVFKHISTKASVELTDEQKVIDNKENWSRFVRNQELEMVDLNHLSNDGRTYVACKTLPKKAGLFAYVAVTVGGDASCGWVNTCGKSIPAPVAKPLDLKVKTPYPQKIDDKQQDKEFQITAEVRSTLARRKSPNVRMMAYELFKRIYGSIEQEMLSEQDPNSTACHDPYVKTLLEKMEEDGKACNNFSRITKLSMLKKKVKNVLLRNMEERNNKLAELEVATTSPKLELTYPASGCPNSMSEMMWQGALMEKPTTKIAEALAKVYPVCLVKVLLALVAQERRKVIGRLLEKQEKLVRAMKKDIQNEVQRGLAAYKVARKEWVEVMRVVMHYNKLKESMTEKDIGGYANSTESGYLLETISKEIESTRNRIGKGNQQIEKLQDDINDLNKNLHEMTEKIECEELQTADALRDFQVEICTQKSSILERARTITELQKKLNDRQE